MIHKKPQLTWNIFIYLYPCIFPKIWCRWWIFCDSSNQIIFQLTIAFLIYLLPNLFPSQIICAGLVSLAWSSYLTITTLFFFDEKMDYLCFLSHSHSSRSYITTYGVCNGKFRDVSLACIPVAEEAISMSRVHNFFVPVSLQGWSVLPGTSRSSHQFVQLAGEWTSR
jgi:hypothetical protein